MYQYRVDEIQLNDGTTFNSGDLTVIVGPNNSGKSRALKDIMKIAAGADNGLVVKYAKFLLPQSFQELRVSYGHLIERHADNNNYANWSFLAPTLVGGQSFNTGGTWPETFGTQFRTQGQSQKYFAQMYGQGLVAYINTEERLRLVKRADSQRNEHEISNLLQALYNGGKQAELEVQAEVERAFQTQVALDFTVPQRLLLRVNSRFDNIPPDPRDAKKLMLNFPLLDDQGDGLRSFVGAIIAVIVANRPLVLFDEPEAFLHPPQAFLLGDFIARHAGPNRQMIVATHSADVLRGIISRRQDITIIRVNRIDKVNSFKILSALRVAQIASDPLLSTARVMEGLFYASAVVVEAESDARLYQLIAQRRVPGCDLHFVNADNKQTVPRVMSPYIDLGVKCAGIVDFDVLSDAAEFRRQLEAIALSRDRFDRAIQLHDEIVRFVDATPIDERLKDALMILSGSSDSIQDLLKSDSATFSDKEKLLQALRRDAERLKGAAARWKPFKEAGRNALPPQLQKTFDELRDICASHGLFINPCGELESILSEMGQPYSPQKSEWIHKAITLIPNLLVDDTKYPWRFCAELQKYLSPKSSSLDITQTAPTASDRASTPTSS